jgi:hypothetical protein
MVLGPTRVRQVRQVLPASREVIQALFRAANSISYDRNPACAKSDKLYMRSMPWIGAYHGVRFRGIKSSATEFAQCILRMVNPPNFALNRLNQYEASLWRQPA